MEAKIWQPAARKGGAHIDLNVLCGTVNFITAAESCARIPKACTSSPGIHGSAIRYTAVCL